MKDKTKKTLKIVIFVILGTVFLLLLPFIQLAMYYITTPKSEPQVKIENYIYEYNKSCVADKQVRIDHYYEGGPYIHCELRFSDETTADDNDIIAFFLAFHNDFGYDNFCDKEINSEFFRKYDEARFDFNNIILVYGDRKTLKYSQDFNIYSQGIQITPEDIEAAVYGIGKEIYVDPETSGKFKGSVYVL